MKLTQFLESKELSQKKYRALGPVEHRLARDMAYALHLITKEFSVEHNEHTIASLRAELEPFAKIPFVRNFISFIDDATDTFEKMNSAKQKLRVMDFSNLETLKAAFKSRDRAKIKDHAGPVMADMQDLDHHIDIPLAMKRFFDTFYRASPSFFGTTRLLASLGTGDYEKIFKTDFDAPLFTSMNLPRSELGDVHYVVFYLSQLKNDPKTERIDQPHELRLHQKVKFIDDADYKELLKLVDVYIHSNNKSLVNRILELINSIPDIRAANEKSKRKYKVLYRGVASDEPLSDEEIIEKDKEEKFVATSDSRRAARNFALQKGHLESDDSRRSKYGYIIEYRVKPEDIVFDTKVIETAYNESEILINAKTSTVENIEEI